MDSLKSKKEQKLIAAHQTKMREKQLENALSEQAVRARSITVGTAFGGTSEITVRRHDGTVVFALLQPVEVVELIHQMAASVGCYVHLQPRKDFASWRNWKHTDEELSHFRGPGNTHGSGHPPHVKIAGDEKDYKTALPPPDQQPGLALPPPKDSNETVATEKPSKRRRVKRAAAAS